jgi:hypothetical protein
LVDNKLSLVVLGVPPLAGLPAIILNFGIGIGIVHVGVVHKVVNVIDFDFGVVVGIIGSIIGVVIGNIIGVVIGIILGRKKY